MKRALRSAGSVFVVGGLLMATSCETLDKAINAGTQIGVATGTIDQTKADAIKKSASAISKAAESITPEQEYYIGRSVAATILERYRPYDDRGVNAYLNVLGQTLASASARPETFGGYHFLALDSEEINAFSAPGGLIFISRGMLALCKSEADVAAVLAHEIGHVEGGHGLKAISRDRQVGAALVTGTELLKQTSPNMGELTDAFGGLVDGLADVLLVKGYGHKLEAAADASAVDILKRVGYDPRALVEVLKQLQAHTTPGGAGFGTTHPEPQTRIAAVEKAAGHYQAAAATGARNKRFENFARSL